MANFSTALEALGSNQVSLEDICIQLRRILDETPDYSQHLLSQLLIAKDNDVISGNDFAQLKEIIEPYLLDAQPVSISNPDSNGFMDIDHPHFTQELTTGTVIKQRFKLLEILGVGGMGRVYKGIDLLKQEARDKNPYVALKLLNEDFRSHPNAFISLQRESSRQQRLAHPNIATVYDFDRVGGPGTPVFITMELLEGQTLNTFIKTKLRRMRGLPFSEAIKIIRQLAAALSYAHEQGIVHSDFKPGNAFICNDGTVKTLDFGIARAVKNTVDGESDRTLFDPRNLGAFTPAYASFEMLLGKAPDTRDDIYALGCVSYEILTGRHPYDKLPATKVYENKLTPRPVKGLKRKQNMALQRALSPKREDRYQTVEDFLTDLEAKYIWYKDFKTVAALSIIILSATLFIPVKNYIESEKINQITRDIKSNDPITIENQLNNLNTLTDPQRLTIINNAKTEIQNYYRRKIIELTNIDADTYNFLESEKALASIKELYPDSNFYYQQQKQINSNKNNILSTLYQELNQSLESRNNINDSITILNKITSRVEPEHPLLKDEKLINTFNEHVTTTLEEDGVEPANSILENILILFPDNPIFIETRETIARTKQLKRITDELEILSHTAETLSDYNNFQDKIHELSVIDPDSPLISVLTYNIARLSDQEIIELTEAGDREQVNIFLTQYKSLLATLLLNSQITELELLHLDNTTQVTTVDRLISEKKSSLDKLLSEPDISNPAWLKQTTNFLDNLSTLNDRSETTVDINIYRERIADIYVDNARLALEDNLFNKAKSFIQLAKQYSHNQQNVLDTEQEIDLTLKKYSRELEVSKLKKEFDVQVNANDIIAASETLEKLNQYNLSNDYFIDTYASKKLSESYAWHSTQAADKENYTLALEFANRGLEYYPLNQQLINDKNEYLLETYREELNYTFDNEYDFDTKNIQQKLGKIESINPNIYINIRQSAIESLSERIDNLAQTDIKQALELANNASSLFPGSTITELARKLEPNPWPDYELTETLIEDGRLTEATILLADSAVKYKDHPDFNLLKQSYADRKQQAIEEYDLYQDLFTSAGKDEDKLINAQLQLQKARSIWTDNENYSQADQNIIRIINEIQLSKQNEVLKPETTEFNSKSEIAINDETGIQEKTWEPVKSQKECLTQYAGYGKRAKAVCYDLVNDNWRGPLMVVIPPGNGISDYYAIGKYEISINDFGKYCFLTGDCIPERDPDKQDLPITNISYQHAIDYTRWLSERTGKTYRLPTINEWRHAGFAAGKQPEKDFNCRVSQGENIIQGNAPVSVKVGNANGWGLKNYIGNIQEWVYSVEDEIKVIGGAYTDALSKCAISLVRDHSSQPDEITGFRVVLEDIIDE